MMNSTFHFFMSFITFTLLGVAIYFSIEEGTEYTGKEKLWDKASWNFSPEKTAAPAE
jgi:hypothetical protein